MKKLPKVLYVTIIDRATENEYLLCSADINDGSFEDGQLIGVYRQTELVKLEIKREPHRVIQKKPKRS